MAKLTDFIEQADIDAALEDDDAVIAYKVMVARQAAEYARSIAPVDEGDYRNGIRVARPGNTGVAVEFSDWKSYIIEYGAEHSPEHAVLSRTREHFKP